jgi:phosphocarrier protein HPr
MGPTGSETSVEITVRVQNKNGLHARPSSVLAETALRFAETSISLRRKDADTEDSNSVVDAKSIMELLLLAAGPGTELTLSADGPQATDACEAIRALFDREFDLNL